jgi:hypothetical protein
MQLKSLHAEKRRSRGHLVEFVLHIGARIRNVAFFSEQAIKFSSKFGQSNADKTFQSE